MEAVKNLVEYYDELFPITPEQQNFVAGQLEKYSRPSKLLSLGCGTGLLEHRLAKDSIDVTGIEPVRELLESATRKYRNQLMSLRYFQMSTLELTKFLGKKFYNIILAFNNFLITMHDETLRSKFFIDCKELLTDGGTLIVAVDNFEKYPPNPRANLPDLSSIRITYKRRIEREENQFFFSSRLENDNKILRVYDHEPVYPIKKDEITALAKSAGFTNFEFLADFAGNPFAASSDTLIAIMS